MEGYKLRFLHLSMVVAVYQGVAVRASNVNSPVFNNLPSTVDVAKDTFEVEGGADVLQLNVTDADTTGTDGKVFVYVEGTVPFFVDDNNMIKVSGSLMSLSSPYELVVIATDGGSPSRQTSATVTLQLGSRPAIDSPTSSQEVSLPEGQQDGSILLEITARDPDNSGSLTYTIGSQVPSTPAMFVMDGNVLKAGSNPFDFETTQRYTVTVTVSDGLFSRDSPPVTVSIVDIDDEVPVFTESSYNISISELFSKGRAVLVLTATDADRVPPLPSVGYKIISGNDVGLFDLGIFSGILTLLDDPKLSSYTLVVQATDNGTPEHTTDVNVTINVYDEFDECAIEPCGRGANCTSGLNYFRCVCPPGYAGDQCQINVNDCDPNPCLNGGSCKDGINSFTCDCVPGYTGNVCASKCTNHTYGYQCARSCFCMPGRIDAAYVSSQMCNEVHGTCRCNDRWTGIACHLDVNECTAPGGATLCDASNERSCLNTDGGYECVCPVGYTSETRTGECRLMSADERYASICQDFQATNPCPAGQTCRLGALDRPFCSDGSTDNTDLLLGIGLAVVAAIHIMLLIAAFIFWTRSKKAALRRKYGNDASVESNRPKMIGISSYPHRYM